MFEIDQKNRKTIYEQVVDNIRRLVLIGVLSEGEKLPSVRDLSRMVSVNPNTVQKAYAELERLGVIHTVSGIGTFVSGKGAPEVRKARTEDTLRRFDEEIRELFLLGLGGKEIREHVGERVDQQEALLNAEFAAEELKRGKKE